MQCYRDETKDLIQTAVFAKNNFFSLHGDPRLRSKCHSPALSVSQMDVI